MVPGPALAMDRIPGPEWVRLRVNFVREGVAGATGAGSEWTAALDHEIGDDPVKFQAIVKLIAFGLGAAAEIFRPFGKTNEVCHGEGSFFKFELAEDFSLGGVKFCVKAIFELCFCHSMILQIKV